MKANDEQDGDGAQAIDVSSVLEGMPHEGTLPISPQAFYPDVVASRTPKPESSRRQNAKFASTRLTSSECQMIGEDPMMVGSATVFVISGMSKNV